MAQRKQQQSREKDPRIVLENKIIKQTLESQQEQYFQQQGFKINIVNVHNEFHVNANPHNHLNRYQSDSPVKRKRGV